MPKLMSPLGLRRRPRFAQPIIVAQADDGFVPAGVDLQRLATSSDWNKEPSRAAIGVGGYDPRTAAAPASVDFARVGARARRLVQDIKDDQALGEALHALLKTS